MGAVIGWNSDKQQQKRSSFPKQFFSSSSFFFFFLGGGGNFHVPCTATGNVYSLPDDMNTNTDINIIWKLRNTLSRESES